MARRTTSEVTDDLADNVGRLIRHELRTIGGELRRKAGQAGLGAGLVAFGLVLALYAGGCMVAGIATLLVRVMPAWLAAAVVAAVLATIAGLAAALGVGEVRRAAPLVPEEAAADIAAAADHVPPDDQRD